MQIVEKFRRFGRDHKGVAAIEMALVFPFMVVLYFGLVDVTNFLSAGRRVTLAASTVADLASQAPATLTKADLKGFYRAIAPIMDPFPPSAVKVDVYDFRKDGTAIKKHWSHAADSGGCGGEPSTTSMDQLMKDGNDLVVTRVCVTYAPIVGEFFNWGPINFEDTLVLRPRQSLTLECPDCTQY